MIETDLMFDPVSDMIHGSFGVRPYDDYALVTFTGVWNAACLELFSRSLRDHLHIHAGMKRAILVDGRNWQTLTPDGLESFGNMNRFLSDTYESLDVAFILTPRYLGLCRYMLESDAGFRGARMKWEFFTELDAALAWLGGLEYSLPPITWDEFPAALSDSDLLRLRKKNTGR